MTILDSLRPARRRGALRGFGNLLDKEQGLWWGTRRWLLHLLLWPLLLNGFVLLAVLTLSQEPAFTAFEIAEQVTTFFFLLGGHVIALGAVVSTQSALVREKQQGTAAWVLSKPVSRSAFLLAKLLAQGGSFLGLAVLLPSVIFYAQSVILWGAPPALLPFVASVLVTALHTSFYLALTLLLGTLWHSSGPISGIAIGLLMSGIMVGERAERLTQFFPWNLPAIAGLLATGRSLWEWMIPIAATLGWTGLFIALALWRFTREEF